jgi:hypothetical protein
MAANNKDLLFYSTYCEHSKNLLTALTKNDLRRRFILVSVDNREMKIPSFITVVPTIYTTTRDLVVDAGIDAYVEKLAEQTRPGQELVAFGFGSSLNDGQYTFISADGNEYDLSGERHSDMHRSEAWNMIDSVQDAFAPGAPPPDDSGSGDGAKFDAAALEKYISQRKSDDDVLKRQTGGARV